MSVMFRHKLFLWCCFFIWSSSASAQLTIEITQGIDNPLSIAVVPFGWQATSALPENVSNIIGSNLERSGQFSLIPVANMLSLPNDSQSLHYRDWRILKTDYAVVGKINYFSAEKKYKITYELIDIFKQESIWSEVVTGDANNLRDLGHYISDKIYEKITGIKSDFSTKILYITANQSSNNNRRYRLYMADADGERARIILESKQPILSPSWSPDGKRIAYVSFENIYPSIFLQELSTGKREKLTNYKGLNGAPAWSPDGKSLAMVLSRDGNPEIYIMNIATKRLQRMTDHYAIDTEPAWMPDGKSLVFTSNRGGKPQIYQIYLSSKKVKRLTFSGDYNARGRISPNGKYLVMVHKKGKVFHIASQHLERGTLKILTKTPLDESPSIAPSGRLIIYATRQGQRGILAAVSIDGRLKFNLPAKTGDVREPAWSPYL